MERTSPHSQKASKQDQGNEELSIKGIGKLVQTKRKEYQIGLKELSIKTRISISVLEAIEKGWKDKLPENTYLIKMLDTLGKELNIEEDKLIVFLHKTKVAKKNVYRSFSTDTFDMFSTWKGSAFYVVVMLISIFLLNKQQAKQINEKILDINTQEEIIK